MMRKLTLVVVMIAAASLGLASGIKWNTDLAAAKKIAKKTNKPIMIDFYGEH